MQSKSQTDLHVAIIMDGNGRWATHRGLPRVAGHRAGVAAVRRVVEHAPDLGIRTLTLYAFSSDNWARPPQEVQAIFWIIRAFLRLECERLRQQGARLQVIGRRDRIPAPLLREIERTESATAHGRNLHLRIAIDYSGQMSIAAAAAASPISSRQRTDRLPNACAPSSPTPSPPTPAKSICSSALAANSDSPISFCGNRHMLNSPSHPACGPTSMRPISPPLSETSIIVNAASAPSPMHAPPVRHLLVPENAQ